MRLLKGPRRKSSGRRGWCLLHRSPPIIPLHDVATLRERVGFAGKRAGELFSNASAALNQIVSVTAKFRQARDMISTQSKYLEKIAHL